MHFYKHILGKLASRFKHCKKIHPRKQLHVITSTSVQLNRGLNPGIAEQLPLTDNNGSVVLKYLGPWKNRLKRESGMKEIPVEAQDHEVNLT